MRAQGIMVLRCRLALQYQSLYTQFTKQQLKCGYTVCKYSYLIGKRYASLGFPVQTKTSLTLNHKRGMCMCMVHWAFRTADTTIVLLTVRVQFVVVWH